MTLMYGGHFCTNQCECLFCICSTIQSVEALQTTYNFWRGTHWALFLFEIWAFIFVWSYASLHYLYSLSFSLSKLVDIKQKPSHQFNWTWQNGEKMVLLCNWAVPTVCRKFNASLHTVIVLLKKMKQNWTELKNQKQWHTKHTIVFSLMASCKRFFAVHLHTNWCISFKTLKSLHKCECG